VSASPFLLGICGPSGSGKTSLTRALAEHLAERSVVLTHDAYYRDQSRLPSEQRALDNALFVEHLRELSRGRDVRTPRFDFGTHSRETGTDAVRAAPVVLVEGILILAVDDVASALDLSVYVHTPLDVCLARRTERDVAERKRTPESVHTQWQTTVLPMHLEHVVPCKQRADLVISGEQDIAASVAQVLERLPSSA
jgi:uridine kinase